MRKTDGEFRNMMKGLKLESPSADFSQVVMKKIHQQSMVKAYQPAIGRKTWIVLSVVFVLFIGFVLINGQRSNLDHEMYGNWLRSMNSLYDGWMDRCLQTITHIFTSIPKEAYIVVLSSVVLWTLDSVFLALRRREMQK